MSGWIKRRNLKSGIIDSTAVADGAVTEAKIGSGAVTEAKIGTGAVTVDKLGSLAVTGAKIAATTIDNGKLTNSTIQAGKLSFFKSTEQTANGASQNVAHGLGRTPALVLVMVTELPAGLAGGFDIAEGAHDGTNVVVTITNACKYIVFAM